MVDASSCILNENISHSIKPLMINKVKDRGLILSPTVQAGLERECCKNDFFREGDKFIGKGGFGEVWKVIHKATNKVYVVKVIDKKSIQEQKLVDQINREIDIMYKVNHPHVMKLVNHFEDDDKFYMIMPYASKGQLYSLVRRQVRFDQRTAAQYMRETIEAIRYLHSFTPKIIHRDIKPENLLLDDNYRILLSDFGWSNFKDEGENRKTYCGTPEYLAPEMVRKTGHDHSVDIWSLGVLLFELLAGYAPFTGANQAELFLNIKKLKINWSLDFPPLAKNLVSKILKLNPKERISLEQISEHSWFDKNPPLRPVLTNYLTDEKKILESHLINVSPDSVKEEINDIVNPDKRRKYSTLRTRKNSSNNSELKTLVSQFQNDTDKIRKENSELKTKLSFYETELKALKTDNKKYNDIENNQMNDQIRQLNDELDKYKIMNNERLGLLTEIEEKSNEIIELKNQNSNFENEKLNAGRIISDSNEKIAEYERTKKEAESKINELNKKYFQANNTHDLIESKYQKQIEILQSNILDSESEESGIANIIMNLSDDIGDLKTNFNRKVNMINENIEAFTTEYKKRESSLDDLLMNTIYKNLTSVLDKFKIAINDNIDKAKEKANKDQKKTDLIDWQKQKINELQQYKTKAISNEAKITLLETQLSGLKDKLSEEDKEIEMFERSNQKNKDLSKELKMKKKKLQNKVEDINEYIEQYCKDFKFHQLYQKAFDFEERY